MIISKKRFAAVFLCCFFSLPLISQAVPLPKLGVHDSVGTIQSLRSKVGKFHNASFENLAKEFLRDYTDQNYYDIYGRVEHYNEGASSVINKIAREGKTNRRIEVIHKFLQNQFTSEKMVVYRGGVDYIAGQKIGFNGKNYVFADSKDVLKKGLSGADKAFSSTSTMKDVAVEFANNSFKDNGFKGVRILEKIIVPKGAHAYNLRNLSKFKNENEWLLDKGLKRVIKKIEYNNGMLEVTERLLTDAEVKRVSKSKDIANVTSTYLSDDGVLMSKSAQRQLAKIEKSMANGTFRNKKSFNSFLTATKKKVTSSVARASKSYPKTMRFLKGVLKTAPIIIEVAMDLHDLYKEVDKYYAGQLTKRDMAISLAGIAGGITGGATGAWLGAKTGAVVGSFIAPGVGTAVGGIVGGLLGSIAGYKIGTYLGKNIMAIATLKYHKTLNDNYYFDRLCDSISVMLPQRTARLQKIVFYEKYYDAHEVFSL